MRDVDSLKDKIVKILYDNSTEEKSSTGTTGEIIIYGPFEDIVNEIIEIIKKG